MKYFIDFEFVEGIIPQQILGFNIPKWLSKPLPNIQMISIGIVSEEFPIYSDIECTRVGDYKQREYYAISKDFNLKAAWNNEWVRENVCKQLFSHVGYKEVNNFKEFKRLVLHFGKTNKQIAQEIIEFISKNTYNEDIIKHTATEYNKNIEFYGYYSDYDWVVFCQLFGTMMDLPSGFPMYCKDLKQYKDDKQLDYKEKQWNRSIETSKTICPDYSNKEHFEYTQQRYKDYKEYNLEKLPNYPKQANEHNALSDAHFNYNLYKFLNTL